MSQVTEILSGINKSFYIVPLMYVEDCVINNGDFNIHLKQSTYETEIEYSTLLFFNRSKIY